jgi:hypothetical protein
LPPALQTAVQNAFLQSLRQVWIAMAVLCGIGLFTLVLIKDIPLRTTTDKKWDVVSEKEKPEAVSESNSNAPVAVNLNGHSGTAEKQDV